jgi:hypothetical protein
MGLQRNHVQGKHQFFYTRQEATPGTLLRGRAVDAVKVISSTITLAEEPTPRRDIQSGRTEFEHIDGPTTVELSGESYVIPNGTVGVNPDCDQILRCALGRARAVLTVNAFGSGTGDTLTLTHDDGTTTTTLTLTEGVGFNAQTSNSVTATNIATALNSSALGTAGSITASANSAVVTVASDTGTLTIASGDVAAWSATRIEYALRDLQALKTLTVSRVMTNGNTTAPVAIAREDVTGVHINEVGFSGSGSEPPRMTFTGKGRRHIFTGTAATEGSVSGSASFTLEAGQGPNFEVDSLVQVGSDTNTGAGYAVTGVATDTITSTGASITAGDATAVVPFYLAPTTAGSPIAGTVGSCTIDGVSYPITAYEVSVNNNFLAIEDEAFSERMTDAVPQYREITGTVTVRARADLIVELGRRKDKGNRAIVITMGSTAGRRCVLSLPQVRFPPSGANVPLEGLADIPMAFRALDSAEGAADALLVQFT